MAFTKAQIREDTECSEKSHVARRACIEEVGLGKAGEARRDQVREDFSFSLQAHREEGPHSRR